MKKLLLILLLCLPAFAFAGLSVTPGTPAHTHTDANNGGATLAFTVSPTSSKACAAVYTRTGPNLCYAATTSPTQVAAVRDTCTAVPSPSADAKTLHIRTYAFAKSANAVLSRATQILYYNDSGCTVLINAATVEAWAYEHTAVVAATTLASSTSTMIAVPASMGAGIWVKLSDDAGNQGTGSATVMGYGD